VTNVNRRLPQMRRLLPSACSILEKALVEADRATAI